MDLTTHWDTMYRTKTPTGVSWYRPHLERSLRMVAGTGLGVDGRILDVGGGASTLVDDLLSRGFAHVTVLDVSTEALGAAQARLGERASVVTWLEADITTADLPRHGCDLWHDRAVFHFLTRAEERHRYVETLRHALRPGGHAIIASFALQGPPRCSGLDVVRYTPQTLQAELGDGFELVESAEEEHVTPVGVRQAFIHCCFKRRDA